VATTAAPIAAANNAPNNPTHTRQRIGLTIMTPIASDIATAVWPLGHVGCVVNPSRTPRYGRGSTTSFRNSAVRIEPAMSTNAPTARRGRARNSATSTIAPPSSANEATSIVVSKRSAAFTP
jgi:hypothetical protein